MLFHASMTVSLPHDMAETTAEALKAAERERAAELHALLSSLPLFFLMEVQVTALCRHPSSIRDGDT
jgi:muconolactone D-isomerase